jgi:tetratricopeptide (TPR) repeat protein
MDAAEKLEAAGELADALKQFERARQLDASKANAAERAIARVRERMTREGTAALRTARQYDALGRDDDAMTWYERAVKLLPDEDPNKKIAKERLEALRARR